MTPFQKGYANIIIYYCFLDQDKLRDPIRGPIILPHTFGQERTVLFVLKVMEGGREGGRG